MGEAYARVTCCAFNDCPAWVQQAEALCIFDDEEGSAVLDRASRVLEFCFPEDIATSFFGELLQADERSFADCWAVLEDIGGNRGVHFYHRGSPAVQCPGLWKCL